MRPLNGTIHSFMMLNALTGAGQAYTAIASLCPPQRNIALTGHCKKTIHDAPFFMRQLRPHTSSSCEPVSSATATTDCAASFLDLKKLFTTI